MTTMTSYRPSALASDALVHASQLIARFAAGPAVSSGSSAVARVRAMATRLQVSDPRFASDLLAAADRHERELESPR